MRRAALLLVMVAACIAQTATPPASPKLYTYYLLPGALAYAWNSVTIDSPLAVTSDASGAAHLSMSAITSLNVQPGVGVLCVSQVNGSVVTLQCDIDTAVVAYRVDPPTAPGPCNDPITGKPYGSGAWASDGSHHFECAQGVWVASVESVTW